MSTLLRQRYIIVTGIPASGKSTIGQSLATELGWPVLDKDEILESLFESRGIGDSEWRTRLSRTADQMLRETALKSDRAVIISWWRHSSFSIETGTPIEWLSLLQGLIIELYCVCRPETAGKRFLARKRHEGHLDHLKTPHELLMSFQRQVALGPLEIGPVIEVNTEKRVEINLLLEQINKLWDKKR
jgi:hypothetical protein